MRRKEYEEAKSQAIEYLKKANMVITDKEKNSIEVTDHGLNMLDKIGL
jgi:predicted transcriptional regulator